MTIEPDTKDWTWVLQRPCPECGYEAGTLSRAEIVPPLQAATAQWVQVLARADVARRPAPLVWSPLEYGCHVRDVLTIFDERLQLMLTQDDPAFSNWDQDQTAIAERYGQQHPAVVAEALAGAGAVIAERFAGVTAAQWERTGRRSDGARFSVDTLGRYFLHDVIHHLYDVHPR